MSQRSNPIAPRHIAVLWALSLGAYFFARFFLQFLFGLPVQSPGLFALVAVLIAASWALVEEPALAPGGGKLLLKAWAALALLVFGEACLYYFVEGKERLMPLALACFAGGWLCLLPPSKRIGLKLLLAILAVFSALFCALAWRANLDLLAGPPLRKLAPITVWVLGAVSFACALILSQGVDLARQEETAFTWRREALGLLAVLALGAVIRFPQMGTVPDGLWYDELNLSRATETKVLKEGQAPLYVSEQVENPGAYLWVGAAVYKVFGTGILPYRYLAAVFGLLALLPFWALSRLWFGPRWALVGAALFGVLRWTLIPQRIGFMSGFALFWMLAAFWAFWSARLKGRAWRWALAGALAGCNLHTYTPGRLVLVVLAAFVALDFLLERSWRRLPQALPSAGWMALGFLATAGPMLWYIATQWNVYTLRSGQVSIFADAARSGQSVASELWSSLAKHLLMFHLRGDFNARHNLHFYPHVDLLTASALALGLPYAFGRFFKDARSRFLGLWFAVMLCAGIFTLAVEAPQGHRTILAAPVLALAVIWALRDLVFPLGERAFSGGWPQAGLAAGLAILLSVAAFNAYEVFGLWGPNSETWRSFSPFATAVGRRAAQSGPDTELRLSRLSKEYLFHGYESEAFARYFLRGQGRLPLLLQMGTVLDSNPPPQRVLLIWGESDTVMTEAFAKEFPEISVERPANPYPVVGECSVLYLAAELPWQRIPVLKGQAGPFLVARKRAP